MNPAGLCVGAKRVKLLQKLFNSTVFWVVLVGVACLATIWRCRTETLRKNLSDTMIDLASGVLASCAVFIATCGWFRLHEIIEDRKIHKFFGKEVASGRVAVVIPDFQGNYQFKKRERPRGLPELIVPFPDAVAKDDLRGVGYISQLLGKLGNTSTELISDTDRQCEAYTNDDANIISLALWSNYCTYKFMDETSDKLFVFNRTTDGLSVGGRDEHKHDSQYDYGLIVKIRPRSHPNRVWFLCGGTGFNGTSGAAWFLANRWNELYELHGHSSFAAIIKIVAARDKSGIIVDSCAWEKGPK